MTDKIYARLNKGSDILAYKPDTYDCWSIIIAYFDVDGNVKEDCKYKGPLSIHLNSLREMRDKMLELRTLGYMINDKDLDKITEELNNIK